MLSTSRATAEEARRNLIGDSILPEADVIVDSAFTIAATPQELWPWIVQLGKGRAGWYYPYWFERLLPKKWRGLRHKNETLQDLQLGDTIGDWSKAAMTVWALLPGQYVVYEAVTPSGIRFSWALVFEAVGPSTRVHSRTRVSPVKRRKLWRTVGGFSDRLLARALLKGLEDRLKGE